MTKSTDKCKWQKCVKCMKRGWHQGVCRWCLDEKRAELLGPEHVTSKTCSVEWCDHEPKGKHSLCAHHQHDDCRDHMLDTVYMDDAAAIVGVSKDTIYRWRDEGRSGFVRYKNTHVVDIQPWMHELSAIMKEEAYE